MKIALVLVLAVVSACSGKVDKKSDSTKPVIQLYGGDIKSTERELVEAGIAKATDEDKLLMVYISAAWCGPCVSFKRYLAADKELTTLFEEKAVVVDLEEAFFINTLIPDFTFSGIYTYPHFQVYNPKTRKSISIDYVAGFAGSRALLESLLKGEPQTASDLRVQLREKFANKNDFNWISDAPYYEIPNLIYALKLTLQQDPIEAFQKIIADLRTFHTENPEQLKSSMKVCFTAINVAIETGKLTLKEVLESYKDLVFTNPEKPTAFEMRLLVSAEVVRLQRSKPAAALRQICNETAQEYFKDSIDEDAGESARLDYMCSIQDLLTGELAASDTEALIEKMKNSLDFEESTRDNRTLANILLHTGKLTEAADAMKKSAEIHDVEFENAIVEQSASTNPRKNSNAKLLIEARSRTKKTFEFYVSEVRAGNTNPAEKYYQESAK